MKLLLNLVHKRSPVWLLGFSLLVFVLVWGPLVTQGQVGGTLPYDTSVIGSLVVMTFAL